MVSAHEGLDISNHHFDIGNDDVVKVLEDSGIGNQTIEEVIGILNSMRGDVVGK